MEYDTGCLSRGIITFSRETWYINILTKMKLGMESPRIGRLR